MKINIFFILLVLASINLHADKVLDKLSPQKRNYILFFYTSWCPACANTLNILNDVATKHSRNLQVLGINLDDDIKRENFLQNKKARFEVLKMKRNEVKQYGIDKSIPVVYVLNKEKQIVKKYFHTPNKQLFTKLIDRLQNGFLENGTLPKDQRVDLWKKDRK